MRWLRFAAGIALLLLVWLVLLPALGNWTPVREHVARLDRAGVNAQAMFYTELPDMPDIAARITSARTRHPTHFWTPTATRLPVPPQ
jgi:hypothetical protein